MRFSVDISIVPTVPFRHRRRIRLRNSKVRLENSGFPNYERWLFLCFDACIEWGSKVDPAAPSRAWRSHGPRMKVAQ